MKIEAWLIGGAAALLTWCFMAMAMTEPVEVHVQDWELEEYNQPAYGPDRAGDDLFPINLLICLLLTTAAALLDYVAPLVREILWPDRP